MHDPRTVAFDIKSPLPARNREGRILSGYHETMAIIWHEDPETDGSDDSCGWAYVRLNEADRKWAKEEAAREWKFWFAEEYRSINLLNASSVEVVAAAWGYAKHHAVGTHRAASFTAWDLGHILSLCSCPGDNFGHVVTEAKESEEGLETLLSLTLRYLLTKRRPWWKHPRWHVHHWRIQVSAWQKFCRWAFSRCARCGGRFAWGYAPTSMGWHGTGPRFLRGEKGVYHSVCARAAVQERGTGDIA